VSVFAASLFDVLSVVEVSDFAASLFAGAPVELSDFPFWA
jgi:hypothetical protein